MAPLTCSLRITFALKFFEEKIHKYIGEFLIIIYK